MQRIIQEGQDFARRHFTRAAHSAYLADLLQQYAQALRYDPAPTPEYRRVYFADAAAEGEMRRQLGGECPHWRGGARAAAAEG